MFRQVKLDGNERGREKKGEQKRNRRERNEEGKGKVGAMGKEAWEVG